VAARPARPRGAAAAAPGPAPSGAPFALPVALFALSGAGALVVETTWLRWLRELLGAAAPAASATLVAFFLGQSLGAAAAARLVGRVRRPLAAYGALELAAAGWALAVPFLLAAGEGALRAVYDGVREAPAALAALRLAAALAATLPSSLAFGATLPVLAAAALPGPAALGVRGAALYGANTLGAALGAAAASFWLPHVLGVSAAYAVGLAALVAAGGVALAVGARSPRASGGGADAAGANAPVSERHAGAPPGARAPSGARRTADRALLAVAAFSGFGTFAAEVLFVQALGLVLDQSVYAFGAVLVVVLVALSVAALGAAATARRGASPAALLAAGAALAALALASFPARFHAATGGLAFLADARPWPGYLLDALATAAATAGPALLAAGLVYPAAMAAAGRHSGEAGAAARLGRLAAANTAGALAGALAAPYLLVPRLGLWPAFAALAGGYAALAVAAPGASRALRAGAAAALAAGLAAVALLASPAAVPALRLAPGDRLVELEPSAAGLVAVVARGEELLVQVDNHYTLGGTAQRVHEERQGHLPLLLRPGARRVAWIGGATGISAGAALAHPLERLALVELVPGVARAAQRHFGPWNRGVYEDPGTEVVLDDGRNFLHATAARFDVVVADLFVPWQAGAASLWTRDHFAAVRARLAPGGLFCQWLPLYQLGEPELRAIAAGFLDVFPRAALFRGDFYGRFPIVALVGYADDAPGADAVSEAARRLAARGERDRWVTHPLGPWALYVGPLAPLASSLADVPRHTDAFPRLEFETARRRAEGLLAREALVGVRFAAFARGVAQGLSPGDPVFGPLDEARLRAAAGGHALQSADALHAAGRERESGQALAAAAALLPPELLAGAPPDPTAAGVWPGNAPEGDGARDARAGGAPAPVR